jgi:5-hydroxyisourate hydrolase
MSHLTTHVLDTMSGVPAKGVSVRLYALDGERRLLASAETNADGRTNAALLEGDSVATGSYELEFDVGAYFATQGQALPEPAFLDTVVVRFSMLAGERYHVPLLASPWSYSTYRGS